MNEHEPLERALRQAYEPDPQVVRRVATKALAERPGRSPWRRAAVFVTVSAAIAWLLLFRPPSRVEAEMIRVDFVGGVAVFEYPDGSSDLFTPDTAGANAPGGLNIILVGGE